MPRSLKGSYILEFVIERPLRFNVGKLGPVTLEPGVYYYTGSARNALRGRLHRHFSGEGKLFWHIDHITKQIQPRRAFYVESDEKLESRLVEIVLKKAVPAITGFGCSDSKTDVTHLFYSKRRCNFEVELSKFGEGGVISIKG